ncbi:MAG: hypothetical protein FJ207_05175 [Gemmatimonadetes bacterium]|nr:hypothetical protein [Gemmatimonadota bacterium]
MDSPARVLIAVLVALSAACTKPRPRPVGPTSKGTVIYVENRGESEVGVYLADGNTPRRVGTVAGLERDQLRIQGQMALMGVRLLVRAHDSERLFASDVLLPGAGGVLRLTVQPLLCASEVSILEYGALAGS